MTPINYDKYEGHTKGPLEAIFHENGDIDICCKDEPWIKIAQMHESLDVDVTANADLFADAPLILQRCMELEELAEQARKILALLTDPENKSPSNIVYAQIREMELKLRQALSNTDVRRVEEQEG